MSTLFENYITGDDQSGYLHGLSVQLAQTFTPGVTFLITSVKALLFRWGTPGIIIFSIRETDGNGKPTGNDLCSGTTDGDTLPLNPPYEWREIQISNGSNLYVGTKYALVARLMYEDIDAYWRRDSTGSYPGGNAVSTTNGGASWSDTWLKDRDQLFEIWGDYLIGSRLYPKAFTGSYRNIKPVTSSYRKIKAFTGI